MHESHVRVKIVAVETVETKTWAKNKKNFLKRENSFREIR